MFQKIDVRCKQANCSELLQIKSWQIKTAKQILQQNEQTFKTDLRGW